MPVNRVKKMGSVEEENGHDCQYAQPVDVINSFHGSVFKSLPQN
jgi:hypothetical protein